MSDGSRFHVSSSMSAKTGVAPAWTIAFALAMNEYDGQITSSPGPIPDAMNDRWSAVVQDVAATPPSPRTRRPSGPARPTRSLKLRRRHALLRRRPRDASGESSGRRRTLATPPLDKTTQAIFKTDGGAETQRASRRIDGRQTTGHGVHFSSLCVLRLER